MKQEHAIADFGLGKRLDIRAAVETDPPVLSFVLHGLMRGYVGGIVAPGGTGKSILMLGIAAEVATGGRYQPLGISENEEPLRVLYLSAEEDIAILHHRVNSLAQHVPPEARELLYAHLHVRSTLGCTPSLVSQKLEPNSTVITELSKWAAETNCALLLLDPLRKWHDVDENDSADATALTRALDEIALRGNCAVVFAHHAAKYANHNGMGADAASARGSSALTDNIRLQINLSKLSPTQLKEFRIPIDRQQCFLALDFSKMNHGTHPPTALLRRRSDGTIYRDEIQENIATIRPVRTAEESTVSFQIR